MKLNTNNIDHFVAQKYFRPRDIELNMKEVYIWLKDVSIIQLKKDTVFFKCCFQSDLQLM